MLHSQPDDNFYLIDSLNIQKLSQHDKDLLDSVLKMYHATKNDTVRLKALEIISEKLWSPQWIQYNDLMHQYARRCLDEHSANKQNQLFFRKILAIALNNKGFYFDNQGMIAKAVDYYHKSLKIREAIGDIKGMAENFNNIGYIYQNQHDLELALEYYEKTLKLYEKLNDQSGIANTLNNIGSIYKEQGDYEKANEFNLKTLEIQKELNNKTGIAGSLNNTGTIYKLQGKNDTALEYLFKSLEIQEKSGNPNRHFVNTLNNIGEIFAEQGKINKAKDYLKRAYAMAQEIRQPLAISAAANSLSRLYIKTGNWKNAWVFYSLHIQMRDSIRNEKTRKAAIRQNLQYEYEKAMLIKEKEQEKKEEKQRIMLLATIAILILVIIFSVIIYNRLQVTRTQSRVIKKQKSIVEKKNKEIIDSINYAKRIQQALLKTEDFADKNLPQHFILFMPKDIVSGDFYWISKKAGYLYIAVADCTGHGVPGGFMSMLGISFLNEINAGQNSLIPSEILELLREKIIKNLSQTGLYKGNKDGMDISLIRLSKNLDEAQWAGANNPLWIIRKNGSATLESIKADRQPIGYYAAMKPFTNHKIKINKSDMLYLFSDGFADQFGGRNKRKFMSRTFKKTLLEITDNEPEVQKNRLRDTFLKWKGNFAQVDDICIIGVKI